MSTAQEPIDSDLWSRWADLAGAEVVRYMRSGQMKLVSMADARSSVSHDQRKALKLTMARKPLDERQLSEHERQIIAGVELGLSDTAMAQNLKLTPPVVKRMRGRLKRLGFL